MTCLCARGARRRKWKDGMFGLLDEDDLDVLLFVYARYKAKGRSGAHARFLSICTKKLVFFYF